MNQNLIGQVLLGQFKVEAFVATGGMGTVFRVWDIKRNVFLAMKMLHADLQDDPSIFKRFKREANALKRLTHPNIVPFYGMYQTDDHVFLLQRYINGPTLKDIIRQYNGQPLPLMEALTYLKALSSSLGYAHANGVVHCDIKPGNLMIDRDGSIFLTDFGIARHVESTTTTFGAAGTAAYMAPEQIHSQALKPSTDIYALGVTMFEMMTGQRPFRGTDPGTESGGVTSAERIRYAHLNLAPPDPRSLNPAIPPELAFVILKALSKQPEDRFQKTNELFSTTCAAVGVTHDDVSDRAVLQEDYIAEPLAKPAASTLPPGTTSSFFQRLNATLGRTGWIAAATMLVMGCIMLFIGMSVFSSPEPDEAEGLAMGKRINVAAALFPSKTPTVTATLPFTATPLPTNTLEPTQTPLPTDTVPPPTSTATLTLNEKILSANILVYEDAFGSYDVKGRPLDKRVDVVLQNMGLTGRNVVRDHDALGDFLGHLNSGTDWDLIIVAAESRNYVRGELWDAIGDNITNSNTSLVAELWYLNQIHIGRITPLLNKCGIDFDRNWERIPTNRYDPNSYIVYWLEPTSPIFHEPRELKRSGLLVPLWDYRWMNDVGDLLQVTGGDAKLLAGTQSNIDTEYGVIAECMDGRIIFQTMSTHDFSYNDTMALWENYITYTLTNHFKVDP